MSLTAKTEDSFLFVNGSSNIFPFACEGGQNDPPASNGGLENGFLDRIGQSFYNVGHPKSSYGPSYGPVISGFALGGSAYHYHSLKHDLNYSFYRNSGTFREMQEYRSYLRSQGVNVSYSMDTGKVIFSPNRPPPAHTLWAREPFLKTMLPGAAKAGGIGSIIIGIPFEGVENYYAVKEGRRTGGEAAVDGVLDVGIGFVSATAGIVLGAKIGGAVGTIVPGLGNAVGIVAGAAIGFGIGYLLGELKESSLN